MVASPYAKQDTLIKSVLSLSMRAVMLRIATPLLLHRLVYPEGTSCYSCLLQWVRP